ncbi:10201_t:CDS:2 [Cetraspora pellucida]|uniref:10201_t:CDS:1 n=1 Tax=Cetraspora pellucida TaxID=1433469 RepID=A0A9N8VYV1_9GLOM|nr:10201_t:CDS:2 [Cetraspora pellucida]
MLATKFLPTKIGRESTSRNGLLWQQFLLDNNNATKTLSPDIITIIQDPYFWIQLYELQNLLFPLCSILNKLQKDIAQWKQPLLLLLFVLHSKYRLSKFSSNVSGLSYSHFDVTRNKLTESSLLKSNNEETDLLVSNDLSIQLSEITKMNNKDVVDDIKENWSHMMKNLISSLDSENCLDNSNVVDSKPLEFELHGHIIHPVDNLSAKWSLLELFDDSLEAPVSFVH